MSQTCRRLPRFVPLLCLCLPSAPFTMICILVQFVLPAKPPLALASSYTEACMYEVLCSLPGRVTPFRPPACDSVDIHTEHMSSPAPFAFQECLLPQPNAMIFGCGSGPSGRALDPIHPLFIRPPSWACDPPQHCMLSCLEELLLLLGQKP